MTEQKRVFRDDFEAESVPLSRESCLGVEQLVRDLGSQRSKAGSISPGARNSGLQATPQTGMALWAKGREAAAFQ